MTEATEARYTLDEARREMMRADCAADGHRPSRLIREMGQELGVWWCDCLAYTWTASNCAGPAA